MNFGFFLLLTVVALGVIIVGSSAYFTWLMQHMVINKLQEIDIIRSTGLPLERWQKAYFKKIQRGENSVELWKKQNTKNLKRLDRLIKYTKKTTLMEDDETRSIVLRELKLIRQEWESEDPAL